MDKFLELKEEAIKKLKTADHILTQSYPLAKDTRLLLAVMDNIFLALTNSMSSLLYYERSTKDIPPFRDNFVSKFNIFTGKLVEKHNIKKSYVDLLQKVKDIIVDHRKSPIEFKRKDSFVICSDDYNIKTITVDNITNYLNQAKSFVDLMLKLIKDKPLPVNNSM